MLKDRMLVFADLKSNEMVGKYYSEDYVMKRILKMSEEQIRLEKAKIEKEAQEKEEAEAAAQEAEAEQQPPENGEPENGYEEGEDNDNFN